MRITAPRFAVFLLVLLASLVSGCAGSIAHMQEISAAPSGPRPGKAMVVFMRPSRTAFQVQSTVYDVQGNDVALIGVLAAQTKVAYEVDPGNRLFMVVGENADFMSAELLPNRTYYVRVQSRFGLWKARFGLDPVPAKDVDTADFKAQLDESRTVVKTASADVWLSQNLQSVQAKRFDYYPEWASRPAAEKPRLSAADGR